MQVLGLAFRVLCGCREGGVGFKRGPRTHGAAGAQEARRKLRRTLVPTWEICPETGCACWPGNRPAAGGGGGPPRLPRRRYTGTAAHLAGSAPCGFLPSLFRTQARLVGWRSPSGQPMASRPLAPEVWPRKDTDHLCSRFADQAGRAATADL